MKRKSGSDLGGVVNAGLPAAGRGGEATVGIMNMALININLAVAMSFKVNEKEMLGSLPPAPMHAARLWDFAVTRHPEERSDWIKSHLVSCRGCP